MMTQFRLTAIFAACLVASFVFAQGVPELSGSSPDPMVSSPAPGASELAHALFFGVHARDRLLAGGALLRDPAVRPLAWAPGWNN